MSHFCTFYEIIKFRHLRHFSAFQEYSIWVPPDTLLFSRRPIRPSGQRPSDTPSPSAAVPSRHWFPHRVRFSRKQGSFLLDISPPIDYTFRGPLAPRPEFFHCSFSIRRPRGHREQRPRGAPIRERSSSLVRRGTSTFLPMANTGSSRAEPRIQAAIRAAVKKIAKRRILFSSFPNV